MADSETERPCDLFGNPWPSERVNELPAPALAYIGDAVFELFVREKLAASGLTRTGNLHRLAVGLVKAQAQAAMLSALEHRLTADEVGVMKRGRNSKGGSVPKGASLGEYRRATGLECLIGHLFLSGCHSRLRELLEEGMASVGEGFR